MENALLTDLLLPGALALIMTSLGLALTPADFRRVLTAPRGVAIGMLNLALISPLLAFTMATVFDLPPELAVGLVLLGASPGGTTANMLTHLARGDTALSVTMTAISSVCSVMTVPLFLALSTAHFGADDIGDVSMLGVVAKVFAITIVPVSFGMWLRGRWPDRVAIAYPRVQAISLSLFLLVVVGAIASEYEVVVDNIEAVAGAALALNVAAMTVSFTMSRVARLDSRQSTAIALELGVHNSTLAIAVGASLAHELSVPAAVYSTFMFITGGTFAWAMSRRNTGVPVATEPTAEPAQP